MPAAEHPARFVIVIGEQIDSLVDDPDVTLLDRLARVVLLGTSVEKAVELRNRTDVIVHVYASEARARLALSVFER